VLSKHDTRHGLRLPEAMLMRESDATMPQVLISVNRRSTSDDVLDSRDTSLRAPEGLPANPDLARLVLARVCFDRRGG
jgi:hypothetical protein